MGPLLGLLRAPLQSLPPLSLLLLIHEVTPRLNARDAHITVELLHWVEERVVGGRQEDCGRVLLVQREAFRDGE